MQLLITLRYLMKNEQFFHHINRFFTPKSGDLRAECFDFNMQIIFEDFLFYNCTYIFWGLPDLECNFQYYFATLYSKESNWIWRRALSDRLSRWYKKPVSTIFTSCLSGMKTFLVARGVSVRPLEYKVFRGGGGNCTPTFHTVQIFRVIN